LAASESAFPVFPDRPGRIHHNPFDGLHSRQEGKLQNQGQSGIRRLGKNNLQIVFIKKYLQSLKTLFYQLKGTTEINFLNQKDSF